MPDDLLHASAQRGVRLIALALFAQVRAARDRLDDPTDAEAVHDFRVAMRRLDAHLRAYRGVLKGSVGSGLRRELRELARAAGESRDAEVQLLWLGQQRPTMASRRRHGVDTLASIVQAQKVAGDRTLRAALDQRFSKVAKRLQRRLARYSQLVDLEQRQADTLFASLMGWRIAEQAERLQEALSHVTAPSDRPEAHAGRIAGKRLRYLLEPLEGKHPLVEPLLNGLKLLQDALGELNDCHLLSAGITARLAEAAAMQAAAVSQAVLQGESATSARPRPGLRAGMVELLTRLRVRGNLAFASAAAPWFGGGNPEFFRRLGEVTEWLQAMAHRDREYEHKFLLSALPKAVEGIAPTEVTQGYLPGTHLVERVRRTRSDGVVRCFRTVKLGAGVDRIEVEEETSQELFSRLWELTEGRRVEKRRYHVAASDGLVWEIDAFLDRELVLAELEVPTPEHVVAIPEWLEPYLVREVTNDPAYLNLNLAR